VINTKNGSCWRDKHRGIADFSIFRKVGTGVLGCFSQTASQERNGKYKGNVPLGETNYETINEQKIVTAETEEIVAITAVLIVGYNHES
jgi:hypothetical protein